MAKPTVEKKTGSPFDALRIAKLSNPGAAEGGAPSEQPDSQMSKPPNGKLAKSTNPEYVKFTTYVRKKTHLAVKGRLVAQERELSDLVEELLNDWLNS